MPMAATSSKQYTILTAGSVSGTFAAVAETNLPSNVHATLSYDATHAYLNLVLNFIAPPGSGLSGNQQKRRQRHRQLLQQQWRHSDRLQRADGRRPDPGLRRDRDRIAADHVQAMTQFMGLHDRSVQRRPRRWRAMRRPMPKKNRATPMRRGKPRSKQRARGLCRDVYARRRWPRPTIRAGACGPPALAARRPPTATPRWDRTTRTSRLFGIAAGRRLLLLAQHHRRLCAGRRRHQFQRRQRRQRTLRPVPGRRLRPPHDRRGLHHRRAGLWLAGRHHRPHRDHCRHRSAARAVQRQRLLAAAPKAAIASSAPWIGGVGITPYAAGTVHHLRPAGLCRTGASPAPTPLRSPMARRASPRPAANSACAPTNPLRCTNAILTLRGRAAWAHDFNPDRAVGATFQTLPGASFVVNGARQASDSALTTASAEMKWMNGWSAAATFEGEFSNVTRSYAGKGVVRYAW